MSNQNWEDAVIHWLDTPPKPVGPPHEESTEIHHYIIMATTDVDVHTSVIPLHVTREGSKELSDCVVEFYYRVPACCRESFLKWFDRFMPHLHLEKVAEDEITQRKEEKTVQQVVLTCEVQAGDTDGVDEIRIITVRNASFEGPSMMGAYIPDGINSGAVYLRYELDALFAELHWYKVADEDGVLIYEGPLR